MARTRRERLALLGFLAVVAAIAILAAVAAGSAAATYRGLRGPAWAPPAWVFGPVWTVLYALVAVAGWLAWRTGARLRDAPMVAYGLQLALNGAWTALFFALGWRGAALLCILGLAVLVAITVALFWRRSRPAAWLLVPYLLWVLFAAALNAAYWALNR